MATIGENEAKQIANCEQAQGRCLLSELMDFGPYEEEGNMQQSIQVDFFYDTLMLAVEKGFPWKQVCNLVQFADEFMATATDKTITEAVRLYTAQSPNLLLELGERNYKVYSDFLFSTFFTHFQLYKYCMLYTRRSRIPQFCMDVHPPVPPLALSEAKEESVAEYNRLLAEVEARELTLQDQRLAHQTQNDQDLVSEKKAVDACVSTVETPFTKDSLGEMMRSVLAEYAEVTGKVISTNVQDVRQDLEVKLEKTALPRPSVLGPPPKYAPKSPIPLAPKQSLNGGKADKKNKNNNAPGDKLKSPPKSPKSARSRGSSRGSKRQ